METQEFEKMANKIATQLNGISLSEAEFILGTAIDIIRRNAIVTVDLSGDQSPSLSQSMKEQPGN